VRSTIAFVSTLSERGETVRVLLIEDNPADVVLVKKAFKQNAPTAAVEVAVDGKDAVDRLTQADRQRPHLVLLDLNLPRMNGHEVLEFVRGHATLRTLPVVVLTSSEDERDIEHSYRLGANSYLTKAPTLAELMTVVRNLADFWFGTAILPPA